jgi:hypothetical protein
MDNQERRLEVWEEFYEHHLIINLKSIRITPSQIYQEIITKYSRALEHVHACKREHGYWIINPNCSLPEGCISCRTSASTDHCRGLIVKLLILSQILVYDVAKEIIAKLLEC